MTIAIEMTSAGTAGDVITLSDAHGQHRTFEVAGGYGLVSPGRVPVRPAKTAVALATALYRALRPLLKLDGTIVAWGEAGALLLLEVEPGPEAPEPAIGTGSSFKVLSACPELPPAPTPAPPQQVTIMSGGRPTRAASASAKQTRDSVWRV